MKKRSFYFFFKRIFDLFFAFFGLLFLFPFFIIIGILIKLDSKGSIFYLQERIGFNGKPFKIWKFRTMVMDADKKGTPLTLHQDPRITKVGRFLRKTKIDELPQLINVIIGNMSLVGPRPEVKKFVDLYTHEQKKVLQFKPGITDKASLQYKQEHELLKNQPNPEEFYITHIIPEKNHINQEYMGSATFFSDLICILKTIF